jgi:predicted extracellular nuclease
MSAFGTNVYYMQSSNQPFSGVWVVGPDSIMAKVANGDSVVVTGTIQEFNEVTEIFNVTNVRVVTKNNPLPEPLVFKTDRFGPSVANGNLNAEPYEGMLVRFDSVTVTALEPVFQDLYQYEVSNSTAPILVTRDGRNTYTNDTASASPGIKLSVGTKIQSLTGILFYNNNRYKVVPRTNSDFGTVTGVRVYQTEIIPGTYSLEQNFPNPFNPTTTIQYGLPVSSTVTLTVYNIIGQEVMTLVNSYQNAGIYSVNFDASRLSSGMYLYRITAGNFVQVKKMMLLK